MADRRPLFHIFDSSLGEKVDVEFGPRASIYTCGITPYDSSHLGHIATFTFFDVLRRAIAFHDIDVNLVRNVTDLDDPLFERVRTSGEDLGELVERNVKQLDEDLLQLNCLPPTHEPYSSEYIPEMISAISKLLGEGNAYTVDGWTYFDTSTRQQFPEFDVLKNKSAKELEEIADDHGADTRDVRMRNPLDFVLWKPSLDDEPTYETPFGSGRPGWHIECSVMAMNLIDLPIDIHGGGDDLVFPHHACEVTQSETLSGTQFVRHFMHVAPINYEGTKMSKSLGNLVYAKDVIMNIGPACTRMMILSHHYREGFEHTEEDAHVAQKRCGRWSQAAGTFDCGGGPGPLTESVLDAIKDDLDTPTALNLIDDAVTTFMASPNEALCADIKCAKELIGL